MHITQKQADGLRVLIFDTRVEMGKQAAADIAAAMKTVLAKKKRLSMVFASAPSQNEMLAYLAATGGIDWQRVIAFNMDEYIGIPADAPQGFGNFLKKALYDKVKPGRVELFDCTAADPTQECRRYAELLLNDPPEIVLFGIGENGHLAFNDPPVADFDDPLIVKTVALDSASRNQQVNDGCFARLDLVPTHAYTVTIPALLRAGQMFGVAPTGRKADAIYATFYGEISTVYPASALRTHTAATLYTDLDGAARL